MKVEFIESEFWGAALFVAEADFKLAKTKDAEFDSLPMPQRRLQICLTWIIPLRRTSTMRLWMFLRKTERLSLRLAPHITQSVAGSRFRYRTTISLNGCFTPMRMGIT